MTLDEFMRISPEQLNRMTEKELRAAVRTAATAANKRIARLGASEVGQTSLAYINAQRRGSFTSKDKDLNALRAETRRIQRFVSSPTSSLRSYKAYTRRVMHDAAEKISEQTGHETSPQLNKVNMADFWKTFRKLKELRPDIFVHYDSHEIVDRIYMVALQSDLNIENVLKAFDDEK